MITPYELLNSADPLNALDPNQPRHTPCSPRKFYCIKGSGHFKNGDIECFEGDPGPEYWTEVFVSKEEYYTGASIPVNNIVKYIAPFEYIIIDVSKPMDQVNSEILSDFKDAEIEKLRKEIEEMEKNNYTFFDKELFQSILIKKISIYVKPISLVDIPFTDIIERTFFESYFPVKKNNKNTNYASLINPDKMYPVSYTIDNNGKKVMGNAFMKGAELTENQIKEYISNPDMIKPDLSQWLKQEQQYLREMIDGMKERFDKTMKLHQ